MRQSKAVYRGLAVEPQEEILIIETLFTRIIILTIEKNHKIHLHANKNFSIYVDLVSLYMSYLASIFKQNILSGFHLVPNVGKE